MNSAQEIKQRLVDPIEVATVLGLATDPRKVIRQGGGLHVCCPARAENTPSCSIRVGPDGTLQVHCFGCDLSGDVFTLIAAVDGLDVRTEFPAVLERAAALAGVHLSPEPPRSRPKHRPPPSQRTPQYPPAEDVASLLRACVAVTDDGEVSSYLTSRGLEPKRVKEARLGLALPLDTKVPEWARFGRRWPDLGHRLLVPVVDHGGEVRSVRAGRVMDGESPKRLSPKGYNLDGLVLASEPARAMLRGESSPERVVVVEGEPDFMTWSTRTDLPVIGIVAGSWTPAIATRIPNGATVVVRVHHDAAGEKYADEIRASLAGRCTVMRAYRVGDGDENDALRAGVLPADPFEGTVPMACESISAETSADDTTEESGAGPDWHAALIYKPGKQRELVRVAANAVTVLANDHTWQGVFAWDAFGESVVTLRPPPWDAHDAPARLEVGPWTDADTTRVGAWLSRHYGLHIASTVLDEAIAVVARRRVVHAVVEYLTSLTWDGTGRIDRWLSSCAGCPDTEYTRAVGAKFLISAVARAFSPGCKVDTVLVLEGPQGAKKSTLIRTLCVEPKWFLETQSDVGSKDSMQQLRRRWLVELGEIDSLSRAEMARVKHFFSTMVDTYRASYGRHARDYPRQCVFIGSTNAAVYLPDPTGARRFWPVRVGEIDVERVRLERDQLWAEAYVRFQAGEAWHIESRELARIFQQEQEARHAGDPWESVIASWVNSPGHPERRCDGVTTAAVLRDALGLEVGRWQRSEETRVGTVLRRLGWESGNPETRNGVRVRVYRPGRQRDVQVDGEVVHQTFEAPSGTSLPTAQPAHPYAGAYIRPRAHAHTERNHETGRAGCAVVQQEPDPPADPDRDEAIQLQLDEPSFADWVADQLAS